MKGLKMKRNNKLLLGLLALLLVMSTGYALFSKEITVGGNVTAKGSFNIGLTCTQGISNDIKNGLAQANGYDTGAELDAEQHGYTTDTCTVSGTSVTVNTDLKYPGAGRYYTLAIKNSGDIRASWNYKTGFVNNSSVYRYYDGAGHTINVDENTYEYNLEAATVFPAIALSAKKSASGTYSYYTTSQYVDLADSEGNIFIEPGETLYFLIYNHWSRYATSDEHNYANGAYMTFTLDYDFTFEQATE